MIRCRWLAAWAAVLAVASCGDDSPLHPVREQVPAWQEVVPLRLGAGLSPSRLLWRDNALYYRIGEEHRHRLLRLPLDDGGLAQGVVILDDATPPPRAGALDIDRGLWMEGDNLLFNVGSQLRSVPITGGPVSTVLDVPDTGVPLQDNDLDAEFFYWARPDSALGGSVWYVQVWRTPRAGGPSQLMDTLEWAGSSTRMSALGGTVLLADGHQAWVVPADGAPTRTYDVTSPPLGFKPLGVQGGRIFWQGRDGDWVKPPNATWLWTVAPGDQAPRILWTPGPQTDLLAALPDGSGGWLLETSEIFSDQKRTNALWSLDDRGRATRLAVGPADLDTVTAVAAAADWLYLALQHRDGNYLVGYSIVRIPRPAPPRTH